MAQQHLTCRSLGSLDGGTAEAMIDREIQRAVHDLCDRGDEDSQTRTVAIKLEMKMIEGMVVTQVLCEAKLPPRKSRATKADIGFREKEASLVFQDKNPENPRQPTFKEMDGVNGDGEIVDRSND